MRIVPVFPADNPIPSAPIEQVRAGWPVTAAQLNAPGATMNWLLGRGVPLVIDGPKSRSVAQMSEGYWRARYYCRPSGLHYTGYWILTLSTLRAQVNGANIGSTPSPTVPASPFTFQSDAPAGSVQTIQLTTKPTTFVFPVALGESSAEREVGYTMDRAFISSDNQSLVIHSAMLVEAPLRQIHEPWPAVAPITTNEQIFDGTTPKESITGVKELHTVLSTGWFMRGALFTWWNFDDVNWRTLFGTTLCPNTEITSTTYVEVFPLRPALQTRHHGGAGTTRICRANVCVSSSLGGSVRLTMTNGAVATFTFGATVDGWGDWGTPQNLAVSTDDPAYWASAAGARGGVRDELRVEVRANAGGYITLLGLSVWDVPGQ